MVSRRTFLTTTGVALAAPLASASAQSRRPLNFVFILADDLGWTDTGCYGSKYHRTPNIDRLATQGMRFTNAYAACPVCSLTRAGILTGKYPARLNLTDFIPGRPQWSTAKLLSAPFRHELPLEEVTIAELLEPLGYRSASIGKWHLGNPPFTPENQSFDLNIAGTYRGAPASYFGPFDLPDPRIAARASTSLTVSLTRRFDSWKRIALILSFCTFRISRYTFPCRPSPKWWTSTARSRIPISRSIIPPTPLWWEP